MTLGGLHDRVEEWCEKTRSSTFSAEDTALDAHLYFTDSAGILATIDPEAWPEALSDGVSGDLSAKQQHPRLIEIHLDRNSGELSGRWYYRSSLQSVPRNLDEFSEVLAQGQRKNFDRGLKRLVEEEDGIDTALLIWETRHGRNFLGIRLKSENGNAEASALELAPVDEATLLLRAGPDASVLGGKSVCVFGAGALGSHVALWLAKSGCRDLTIVDRERLRPGNVVRHVCNREGIGYPKAETVKMIAKAHAPWTTVKPELKSPWNPQEVQDYLASVDLVVDTTGLAAFTTLLSHVAERAAVPMVSVALYRGGSVSRVLRQLRSDGPIHERQERGDYRVIPPGDDEEWVGVEVGCSSPVANAPPVSVATAAALATHVIIDVLTNRNAYAEEVIEVYRALSEAPFDRLGRVGDQSTASA